MKINSTTLKLYAAIIGFLTLLSAHNSILADEVKIPVGQQSIKNQGIERPKSGMSKGQVEQYYGMPQRVVDTIGEPPISSWEYPNYIVYFEHDRVIHAVLK